jgi:acyl-CoA synthetase (AMP-forming)/AMP-acid ligase II
MSSNVLFPAASQYLDTVISYEGEVGVFLGVISARREATPDDPAVSDGTATMTWAELAAAVEVAATRLLELPPGSRLGVAGENAVPTLVAHVSGLVSGVGTVALHRQATATELQYELYDVGCRAVVVGASTLDAASAAVLEGRVDSAVIHGAPAPPGFVSWADWTSGPSSEVELAVRPANPLMVYTSGTTGRARATPVTWVPHRGGQSALDYLTQISSRSGFPAGPHLVVGPLQHNGPLTSLRHLVAGEPVIVMPRFDATQALRLIEQYRVTSSVMVPTHFTRLLALPAEVRASADVSSLRMVAHTGSACPDGVKRAMIDWFGPILVESYGGSEIGTVARITSAEWLTHPGSVGKAVAPLTISAYDADGQKMPPGEVGVLGIDLVDGREVKFVHDEKKSRDAYLRPGVATLGDIGYLDRDGFVYITDRLADMVLSGGVNLYPAECEQVLLRHPAVSEVAVIGIPDQDMGEALHALIVAATPDIDLDQLNDFCRLELAGFKCPRSYELVPELQRNEMGKADKRGMRAAYWSSPRTISG